jgi:hypothetical protein
MTVQITQAELKEKFEYDSDGHFVRRINGKLVKEHTSRSKGNHLVICLSNKTVRLQRMIFLYHHGYLPICVDHIDGNVLNNRIENLRAATFQENCLNKRAKPGPSGCKNVRWSKPNKKWVVYVSVNRKQKFFGGFKDLEFADLVATEARNLYHGAYARHF